MKHLSRFIAVLLVTWLAYGPAIQMAQAETPAPSPAPTHLSNAVVSALQANMAVYSIRKQAGTLTVADVQGTIVAVTTFFGNMKETGQNDFVEQQILANADKFLNAGISQEQIESQYSYLVKSGMKITLEQYRNSLLTTQAERQQLLNTIKSSGMAGIESQLVGQLQEVMKTLPANDASVQPIPATFLFDYHSRWQGGRTLSQGRLMRAEIHDCAALAAIFAIAAFFCPPLAIIAAVYALEDALGLC